MLLNTKSARADIIWSENGPTCPLPHSPYTHETATPASRYLDYTPIDQHDFVCSLDEDDDGIHDDIENAIADCFAPYLVFDSKENARATGIPTWPAPNGAEPVVAYTAEPTTNPHELRLSWLTMWNWDGGFERLEDWPQ